ncbi:MAG TPA: hypothetical protein VK137_11785, partial [Planctomycetaceae bacterium]|nr:hypothetical protein [Planctomycetaceae bacterium]
MSPWFELVLFAALGILFGAFSSPSYAQVASSDGASATDEPTAPKVKAKESPEVDWEKLIYLPYRELRAVFEKQKATVFMPYVEYLKLIAKGEPPAPGQPPVAAVISAASYRATVDHDVARIEAEYTVRVLGKAWSELPIKFGNAAVGEVTSEAVGDAKADKV